MNVHKQWKGMGGMVTKGHNNRKQKMVGEQNGDYDTQATVNFTLIKQLQF